MKYIVLFAFVFQICLLKITESAHTNIKQAADASVIQTDKELDAYLDDGSSESVPDERLFGDSSSGSQDDIFGDGGITNTDMLAKVPQKAFTYNEVIVPNILGPPQILPVGSFTLSPIKQLNTENDDKFDDNDDNSSF